MYAKTINDKEVEEEKELMERKKDWALNINRIQKMKRSESECHL